MWVKRMLVSRAALELSVTHSIYQFSKDVPNSVILVIWHVFFLFNKSVYVICNSFYPVSFSIGKCVHFCIP